MSDQANKTTPSGETRAAEEAEAKAPHEADRPANAEEAEAAPGHADPATAEGYKEMTELGANVEGEGKLP